jgi:YVTN family beta-propeller protein
MRIHDRVWLVDEGYIDAMVSKALEVDCEIGIIIKFAFFSGLRGEEITYAHDTPICDSLLGCKCTELHITHKNNGVSIVVLNRIVGQKHSYFTIVPTTLWYEFRGLNKVTKEERNIAHLMIKNQTEGKATLMDLRKFHYNILCRSDTIDVRGNPYDLEYSVVDEYVYVMNSPYVTVFDPESDNMVTNYEVDINLREMTVNSNNGNIYLSTLGNHAYVIDRLTSNVDNIEIGSSNYAVEDNPTHNKMYVSKILTDEVTIIDAASNEVISTVKVGDGPFALEYNLENDNLYVANRDSDDISVIDGRTNEVTDTIPVGNYPFTTLEYNPNTNKIYVANWGSQDVSVIDGRTNEVTDTISVGADPFGIKHNPSNNFMYVGNTDSDTVSIINSTFTLIFKPFADAGSDQSVKSDEVVQLDGTNSSDPNGFELSYFWNQTAGPEVTLSDSTSTNPTFTAPEVNEQTDLRFELTVTNEEGIVSEPDEVVITVNPVAIPPPNEEPKTIGDLIKDIIQNPLDITNSIDSANQIRDILTDNDRDNDKLVCNLINSEDESTSGIREILNC